MSVIETLTSSIRTGEIVTIVYHGGSNQVFIVRCSQSKF